MRSRASAPFRSLPPWELSNFEPFLALNIEASIYISEKQYQVPAGLARNCRFFLVEHAGPRPGAFAPRERRAKSSSESRITLWSDASPAAGATRAGPPGLKAGSPRRRREQSLERRSRRTTCRSLSGLEDLEPCSPAPSPLRRQRHCPSAHGRNAAQARNRLEPSWRRA